MDKLYIEPTYRELVDAINQFVEERPVTDINMIPLYRVWIRFDYENIKPCPECDGGCDEPCNMYPEDWWQYLNTLEKKFKESCNGAKR